MKRTYLLPLSIALVALLILASCVGPQPLAPAAPRQQQGDMTGSGTMGGGGGMMGGGGGMMGGGGGMMGGGGGMMGGGGDMMGGGGDMMGGSDGYSPQATPLTLDEAAAAVRLYLKAYGQGLSVAEVMEFARNFYAEVEEEGTGTHAMELLIDKHTGRVYPETGPNMMWNTKYSVMGRMMGGDTGGVSTAQMPVPPERAKALAQQFLDASRPGLTVGDADIFYGYYTLHTLQENLVEGMLSVNGYTGTVWYHDWHGPFVGMAELGKGNGH